eukprot:396756_1
MAVVELKHVLNKLEEAVACVAEQKENNRDGIKLKKSVHCQIDDANLLILEVKANIARKEKAFAKKKKKVLAKGGKDKDMEALGKDEKEIEDEKRCIEILVKQLKFIEEKSTPEAVEQAVKDFARRNRDKRKNGKSREPERALNPEEREFLDDMGKMNKELNEGLREAKHVVDGIHRQVGDIGVEQRKFNAEM